MTNSLPFPKMTNSHQWDSTTVFSNDSPSSGDAPIHPPVANSSVTEKQKDGETFKGMPAKSLATEKQKYVETFKGVAATSSATEKQTDGETFKGVAATSSATEKQKDGQTFKGRKGLYTSMTQTYSNEVVRHIHFHMLKIRIGQQWRPGWRSGCPGNDKTKDGTFKLLPWHQQKLKMVHSSSYPGINETKDSVF